MIYGEDGRRECLDFIEKNWTDMRPKSLIEAMEADAEARSGGNSMNGEDAMAAEKEKAGKK